MDSRVLRGAASGPAEWLLVFLQARDVPPRARSGTVIGPVEWLLVFLDGANPVRASARMYEHDPAENASAPRAGEAFLGRLAAQGA